ncbi:MAG: hypothetical protein V9G19_08615 [Tetrasphaera sp.]
MKASPSRPRISNAIDLDQIAQTSRSHLRDPWAIDREETLRSRSALILAPPSKADTRKRDEGAILRGGVTSRLGRALNKARWWGGAKLNPTITCWRLAPAC